MAVWALLYPATTLLLFATVPQFWFVGFAMMVDDFLIWRRYGNISP